MRTWTLRRPSSLQQTGGALANIVGAIGDDDFGPRTLRELNKVFAVGCWSVYRIGRCSPVMYLSGSHERSDTTLGSWRAYLSGPHLTDRTLVLDAPPSQGPAVCHVTAEEIPSRLHREKVYHQFGMIDRLSIVEQEEGGAVFAVNLYRYRGQNHFSDRELNAFETLAQPLLAAVRRHLSWRGLKAAEGPRTLSVARLRETLHFHRPDLPERELDVCARALAGMSYEGIAADLGLKVPTVKTYRNRAFARLGIRFRSELLRYYLGLDEPGP